MTNKNDITALRNVLFDTIEQLNNKDNPMEIERAKVISDVAQTIINTAKVEIDHARVTGGTGSTKFLSDGETPAIESNQEPEPEIEEMPEITGSSGYIHKMGQRRNT